MMLPNWSVFTDRSRGSALGSIPLRARVSLCRPFCGARGESLTSGLAGRTTGQSTFRRRVLTGSLGIKGCRRHVAGPQPVHAIVRGSASAAECDKLRAFDHPLLGRRSAFACVEAGSVHPFGRPIVVRVQEDDPSPISNHDEPMI